MKTDRIESRVGWFSTGGILLVIGCFLLWKSWQAIHLGVPFGYRGHEADPQVTMGGSVLIMLIGGSLILGSVIAKVRSRR
jgi:hypothetical protein